MPHLNIIYLFRYFFLLSYFVQRICEEMELWFDVKFAEMYYVHPGGLLAPESIRGKHINALRHSCERLGVVFREITSNVEAFLNSLIDGTDTEKLCVLDDLGPLIFESRGIYDALTRVSHHNRITYMVLLQSFFVPGKNGPAIRKNFTDFVLFPSIWEMPHQADISAKLFNGDRDFLNQCVEFLNTNIDSNFNRYVWIDHNTTSNPFLPAFFMKQFAIRTNLFKDKNGNRMVIYLTPPHAP